MVTEDWQCRFRAFFKSVEVKLWCCITCDHWEYENTKFTLGICVKFEVKYFHVYASCMSSCLLLRWVHEWLTVGCNNSWDHSWKLQPPPFKISDLSQSLLWSSLRLQSPQNPICAAYSMCEWSSIFFLYNFWRLCIVANWEVCALPYKLCYCRIVLD